MDGSVYVCWPSYGQGVKASAKQFWAAQVHPEGPHAAVPRIIDDYGSSLLADSFNFHWTSALNLQRQGKPITRFAMLHDDIVPESWWLEKLITEHDACGADLLAALVPIKDTRGLTSTAIDDPKDQWDVLRRITMAECASLPETFSAADCGYPDNFLLANTGCWICDFTKGWRFRVKFEIDNAIAFQLDRGGFIDQLDVYVAANGEVHRSRVNFLNGRQPLEGHWQNRVRPEDWNFSRQVGRLGGRVMVTRKVRLSHIGKITYMNYDTTWGTETHDSALAQKFGARPIGSEKPRPKVVPMPPGPGSVYPEINRGFWPSKALPDVDGWLSDVEGDCLARHARGRRVLEIGCYRGRSTIWMARTATSVLSVDPMDDRGAPRMDGDTHTIFEANVKRYCAGRDVNLFLGTSEEFVDKSAFQGQFFDLIFIDGAHDYESVKRDIELCWPLLVPKGVLAFHDYHSAADPGVTKAVDEFWEAGAADFVEAVGTVAVLRPHLEPVACSR